MLPFSACLTDINQRAKQQDAASIKDINDFNFLSVEEENVVFSATIAQMQNTYGQHEFSGSTLCTTIAWTKENQKTKNRLLFLTVANLGDSLAYCIILHPNNTIDITPINRLHKPQERREKRRLKESGFPPATYDSGTWRLRAKGSSHRFMDSPSLAMSRSLGDRACEHYGLIHIPEIRRETGILPEGARAFILVASDGLENLTSKIIGNLFLINRNNLSELAQEIVASAKATSTDNISVAIFEVKETPTSALILDGHGSEGEKVSFGVCEAFYPALTQEISQVFTPNRIKNCPLSREVEDFQKDSEANGENPFIRKTSEVQIDSNLENLQQIVMEATLTYTDWNEHKTFYDGIDGRGAYGFFTFFRHTKKGIDYAKLLAKQVSDAESFDEAKIFIDKFLNRYIRFGLKYNIHSCASYLLEGLMTLEDSPWSKLRSITPRLNR